MLQGVFTTLVPRTGNKAVLPSTTTSSPEPAIAKAKSNVLRATVAGVRLASSPEFGLTLIVDIHFTLFNLSLNFATFIHAR